MKRDMVKIIEIRDMVLYLDGNNFAFEIIKGCGIQTSHLTEPATSWLTFNPDYMNKHIDQIVREIFEYIFDLRLQQRDDDAVRVSDAFFQSFTPLMDILVEQRNFQVSNIYVDLANFKGKKA
jgi:hypothetical protein